MPSAPPSTTGVSSQRSGPAHGRSALTPPESRLIEHHVEYADSIPLESTVAGFGKEVVVTDRGRPRFASIPVLLMVAGAAISAQNAPRPTPSTARGEWPTYGGDLAGSKYSPTDQINRDNFTKLKVAWRTKSPDAVLSMSLPGWRRMDGRLQAGVRRAEPARPEALARRRGAVCHQLQGDAADGRRHAVSELAAVARHGRRRQDRRGPLGLQPEKLRGRHDDDERAVEPARRRLLDRRHRGARVLGHRRRLPRSRWTPRPASRSRPSAPTEGSI